MLAHVGLLSFIVAYAYGGFVFMHGSLQGRADEQTKIQRSILQGAATICSSPFGRACKGVWPVKTAEELASRAGCSVRAAAYQLSGEHDPSVQSMLALVDACTPKRGK